MMKDVEVTGRFSKLVYQFPIRIPERPGFFHGHEAVEWCPEDTFFLYRIFFFFQKDDNYNNGTTDRRKKASEAGLHCKLKGIQEVSWQQAVCFVRSAVSAFSWAFCGKLQKPWDILIAGPGFRLWSALCWCKKGFACGLFARLVYVENTLSGMHKHFNSIQSGSLPVMSKVTSPFIGVKNPHIPIYFRPFIGVIYNSMYIDRLGAHFV